MHFFRQILWRGLSSGSLIPRLNNLAIFAPVKALSTDGGLGIARFSTKQERLRNPISFRSWGKWILGGVGLMVAAGYVWYHKEWPGYPEGVKANMRMALKMRNAKRFEEAAEKIRDSMHVTQQMKPEDDNELKSAFLRIKLAEILALDGKYEEAGKEYAICFDVFRRHHETEKCLSVIQSLTPLLEKLQLRSEAHEILQRGLQAAHTAKFDENKLGPFYQMLAQSYHEDGNNEEEAKKNYLKAIEIAQKTTGEKNCDVGLMYNNLSAITLGEESLVYAKKALKIAGNYCPEILALSHLNLARAYAPTENQKAIESCSKAAEIAGKEKEKDFTLLREIKLTQRNLGLA